MGIVTVIVIFEIKFSRLPNDNRCIKDRVNYTLVQKTKEKNLFLPPPSFLLLSEMHQRGFKPTFRMQKSLWTRRGKKREWQESARSPRTKRRSFIYPL